MLQKFFCKLASTLAVLAAFLILTGCQLPGGKPAPPMDGSATDPRRLYSDLLQPGDVIYVTFSGVTTPPKDVQDRIREDGKITLELIGDVQAAGLTRALLQQSIYKKYVDEGKYFSERLSVNVNTGEGRYIYVTGEVKAQGKYPYTSSMSVLKSIASAGGFTDFANRTITLTRASTREQVTVDCRAAQLNPALDVPVYPGDIIDVKRRGIFNQ